MAGYPKELIAKAKFELRVFDRVSRDTGAELLAEVEAWRARFPEYEHRAPDACVALREPAEKPGPDFLHPPEAEASGPSSTPAHDMVKGGWVATSDGPSGIGFVPRIARVREVHDDGLLDLVLYSFTGERIGRESPAMGGTRRLRTVLRAGVLGADRAPRLQQVVRTSEQLRFSPAMEAPASVAGIRTGLPKRLGFERNGRFA